MARPYWQGQVTISLVSFGVKLFVATEAKGEVHFHQINKKTGERVKYQKVNASAAEGRSEGGAGAAVVEKDEIVKGYEYEKGRYVTIEPEEFAHLRVPSKHTMEVTQFVDEVEIGPEYFEKPYFVVPENDTQTQAFAVVRQALEETKKVALSTIAFGGREHVVALMPAADGGMMAYTMRYSEELRDPREYFRDIKKVKVDEDSLDLAKQLIKKRAAKFEPEKFVDGYEVALKELVQAKVDHAPVPKDEPVRPARGKVVSLMDALRKSVGDGEGKKGPAKGMELVKKTGTKVAAKRKTA